MKKTRQVGTPEHSSALYDEIRRLEKALVWVKDNLLNDPGNDDIHKTIKAVLDGEHHDIPGEKAISWEDLRP